MRLKPFTTGSSFALKARWVFPVISPPIAGGVVSVRDGRIAAIGDNVSGAPVVDLGDAAILPGLVNAHTHLEFSELASPLGGAGMPFPAWIREVVAWRRTREESPDGAERRERATEQGLQESLATGVAAIGEIASPGWPSTPFEQSALQCTIFQELLGLAPERREPLLELAKGHIAAGRQSSWRPALSPHAPYTASIELVEAAAELSRRDGVPVAMHLAESREELELLGSGSGPFYELLSELAGWSPRLIPRGLRAMDFLERLAGASRALVIHGNYLDDEEIELLGRRRETMSVVYCPRTHHYFRQGRYPLEKLLQHGARVALGTDSRASNPDLSLWEEMRFVARHFPNIAPATALHMGTLAGGEALGLADECGALAVGRRADLAIIQLPAGNADDPHELLCDDGARIGAP